ncbi:Transcriptional repressor NrdR [Planctomycetes bacterium Poly30]|uniref:Transcriptional repressor NrdR n=2 Tax=Saltatorellus ferox TaxID=2528018 RepID=A0A518ES40_9BACT|nr:Transcriptional repressor NrdR [Planctomycetes bacterium Poly30]
MRFTTYERIEESPLRVIKKNGDRVRFDRDRILAGILRACEKLPISAHDIEEVAMRVEARCQGEYDREVPSSVIGSLVMEELRALHQVAYVRFASVYREFKDVGQFMSELETILDEDADEMAREAAGQLHPGGGGSGAPGDALGDDGETEDGAVS